MKSIKIVTKKKKLNLSSDNAGGNVGGVSYVHCTYNIVSSKNTHKKGSATLIKGVLRLHRYYNQCMQIVLC